MSRYTIILLLIGAGIFFLSTLHIDIFTWKDSNSIERVVITAKKEEFKTDYPSYPEELKTDDRLQHGEGIGGLGQYGMSKIKEYFPSKEEEETDSQQANLPNRPHTVGKVAQDPASQQAEAEQPQQAPQASTITPNQSVGTAAELNAMRKNFNPDPSARYIKKIFNPQGIITTASFSVDPLRPHHLHHQKLKEELLGIFAQFDLLAVQGIYTENSAMLQDLCTCLTERTGRPFNYVTVFPRENRSKNRPLPVFFYDSNVLEVDSSTIQLLGNVNRPFAFPPLAAKFRARNVDPKEAFTFIAVNMQMYPGYEQQEIQHVPNMMARLKEANVRGQFNREDDIVIYGYFGLEPHTTIVGDTNFNQTITWANSTYPTNTYGTYAFIGENILFQTSPLVEYSDISGVWDLKRQMNLLMSIPFDHHPVFACFGIQEGKKPNYNFMEGN